MARLGNVFWWIGLLVGLLLLALAGYLGLTITPAHDAMIIAGVIGTFGVGFIALGRAARYVLAGT